MLKYKLGHRERPPGARSLEGEGQVSYKKVWPLSLACGGDSVGLKQRTEVVRPGS